MVLESLTGSKKKIAGVIKDPAGKRDLDVWYSKDAITPEVMKELRGMTEDTAEEDGVRTMLVTFGMEWNLQTFRKPEAAGGPTVDVELPNGRYLTVAADDDGQPIMDDVPSTFEGMKVMSLPALFAIFKAIQEDARPKEANSEA